jgi:hypothetical protein
MPKFTLIPFDLSASPNISIEVEVNQNIESLFISFSIKNGVDLIDLGTSTPSRTRVIKLWEKTCFEFFLKNTNDNYIEFNFSPNFEWNCFYFKKQGDPLLEYSKMTIPKLDILLSSSHYLLIAEIKKELFPEHFFDKKLELSMGLTSVIKDKLGRMSYWALDHKDTRPNFHHFDSFKYKF